MLTLILLIVAAIILIAYIIWKIVGMFGNSGNPRHRG